jgi:hypothetical protein
MITQLWRLEQPYELHKSWRGWDDFGVVNSSFWFKHDTLASEEEAEAIATTDSILTIATRFCYHIGIPVVPVMASVKGATAKLLGASNEVPPENPNPYTIVRRKNSSGKTVWYYAIGASLRSCMERRNEHFTVHDCVFLDLKQGRTFLGQLTELMGQKTYAFGVAELNGHRIYAGFLGLLSTWFDKPQVEGPLTHASITKTATKEEKTGPESVVPRGKTVSITSSGGSCITNPAASADVAAPETEFSDILLDTITVDTTASSLRHRHTGPTAPTGTIHETRLPQLFARSSIQQRT